MTPAECLFGVARCRQPWTAGCKVARRRMNVGVSLAEAVELPAGPVGGWQQLSWQEGWLYCSSSPLPSPRVHLVSSILLYTEINTYKTYRRRRPPHAQVLWWGCQAGSPGIYL